MMVAGIDRRPPLDEDLPMQRLPLLGLLLYAAAVAGAIPCRAAPPGEPPAGKAERYETRKVHDPDGIGKFYMGREIAQVMGHQAAGVRRVPAGGPAGADQAGPQDDGAAGDQGDDAAPAALGQDLRHPAAAARHHFREEG